MASFLLATDTLPWQGRMDSDEQVKTRSGSPEVRGEMLSLVQLCVPGPNQRLPTDGLAGS
jgi:hypothetical protein